MKTWYPKESNPCGTDRYRPITEMRGFLLVELMVVVGIVSILAAIAIPSIRASRELARSMQCKQRVHNLVAAVLQHEHAKKRFPGWIERFGYFEEAVDPSNPETDALHPNQTKVGTWAVSLLPYIENQSTYEIWTDNRYPIYGGRHSGIGLSNNQFEGYGYTKNAAPNIEFLQCPSDPTDKGQRGRLSYVTNNGFCHLDHRGVNAEVHGKKFFSQSEAYTHGLRIANGALVSKHYSAPVEEEGGFSKGPDIRLRDIQDRLSKTVLISENLQTLPWHRAGLAMHNPRKNSLPFNTPAIRYDGSAVSFARYTVGMVFFYEDDDPQVMNQAKCHPVSPIHRINGGLPGKDKFLLAMPSKVTPKNLVLAANLARPSSAHDGGVHMGFADGAVRFISETIDYRVYQTYMTLDGKKSDMPYRRDVMVLSSPEEGE